MTPLEHTHDEATGAVCGAEACDVWPRIVDYEVTDTGTRSWTVIASPNDFVANRLNSARFTLGWGLFSEDDKLLRQSAKKAQSELLSAYLYLANILYPEETA